MSARSGQSHRMELICISESWVKNPATADASSLITDLTFAERNSVNGTRSVIGNARRSLSTKLHFSQSEKEDATQQSLTNIRFIIICFRKRRVDGLIHK